ncbi:MAG: Threonine synthase [Candidatus Azambacteria bacterium GW2011_GWB2_46_37]|uniref:Threonine synthase n=4 Tax=Candidatus Azamiibacteriota TaxID=1752741 RepID=A0A0G1T6D4_9BACT|nr:MAG: Threonine synthase [Candidatus Azambacteria bacterium GW2011_GWB1_46_27]KKU38323.1 MAG: Threonine synthase [Candidatus Azambacteria bacterium GW2011_GWF2_46_32]KKU39689.1 MAG: Threonine synthase [Candidatus Azambacteria bacterium GW2011_GWB2_46_37]KKU40945.1 MAG: Threonine synthase [Candidatus Azambacteria bacterium GW2011_GWD2_46_48]HBA52267.1 threonine synthase [Candidatus Azambacteria bacterium]
MQHTYLQCISCDYKTDLLEERKFRCPDCGDLYDIKHNFEPLLKSTGTGFNALTLIFDERAKRSVFNPKNEATRSSGVWRFKELIMPYLDEKYIVTLGEGNVPIVPAGKHLSKWLGKDVEVWMILEGMTPTGSFKDFGGTVLMSVAKAAGIQAIACASTGDTSAMTAAYAAAAGIECAVILPKGFVTSVQLAQPLAHGAKIINLPGNFDDCMRVMQELVRDYGVYPANSLNPARIEGHQTTVFLTAQFFGWQLPDWFAVPVGNGSNCSSIGKALRLMESFGRGTISKILGCQSEAANPLAKSWAMVERGGQADPRDWKMAFRPIQVGETTATAARIGNPVSRDKVMREIFYTSGAMQIASERDLNEAVAVCGKDGYFVCPQTGIALAGTRNAIKRGWIKKDQKVVVVSTATGLKFTDSVAAGLQNNITDAKDCETSTVAKILRF